jgi:uncharacterized delta-60 repeat protein
MRVLSLVLMGLLSQTSKAADGLWDARFGGDPLVGVQVAPFPGQAHVRAVTETADGAVWMAGYGLAIDGSTQLAVSRMGENGEIDGAFANGQGALLLPVQSSTFGSGTTSAAVDLASAGRANPQSVLVAFQYTTQVESAERGAAAAILPLADLRRDDVPMVDGAYRTGVARIDAEGKVDRAFGDDGIAWVAPHAASVALARDLAVASDGSFYMLETGFDQRHAFVTRFDAQGAIDTQFAHLGVIELEFAMPTQLTALTVDRDGGLVVAGATDTLNDGNWNALVLRILADGQLDASYGNAGQFTLSLDLGGDLAEVVNAVTLDGKNHLVLVGSARTAGGATCFATRLDASGLADLNWAVDGSRTFDIVGLSQCRAISVSTSQSERVAVGVLANAAGMRVPAVQALNNATGAIDLSYGLDATGSVLALDFAVGGSDIAVHFDDQGRTLLALTALHDKPYEQAYAARLTEDGAPSAQLTARRLR